MKIKHKVFLNARNIIFIKSFKKLNYKYYESYMINESINKILYKLDLFFTMKDIHNVFHVFFLKLANDKENETSSFIWVEDEKQWKIKKIVDKRTRNDKTSYLIKWLEYSHSNNEWIKAQNMSNVQEVIENFSNMSLIKNDKCVNKRRCTLFRLFFTRFFIIDFNETWKCEYTIYIYSTLRLFT